jgi:hypothetical protein
MFRKLKQVMYIVLRNELYDNLLKGHNSIM